MSFIKRGTGEVLPESSEQHKTASNQNWTDKDERELAQENEQADRGQD